MTPQQDNTVMNDGRKGMIIGNNTRRGEERCENRRITHTNLSPPPPFHHEAGTYCIPISTTPFPTSRPRTRTRNRTRNRTAPSSTRETVKKTHGSEEYRQLPHRGRRRVVHPAPRPDWMVGDQRLKTIPTSRASIMGLSVGWDAMYLRLIHGMSTEI